VSSYREQALIDAPVQTVWELLGDPNRHPEWWPKMVEVQCEGVDESCRYRQVVRGPFGDFEEEAMIERLEDCRMIHIRCLENNTYLRWALTEARGSTFVDAEFGCEPERMSVKAFDVVAGKRFFRRWLQQSLDALKVVAERAQAA
jgi:uncharacterized protein YndB with AHSA1/START domain